MRYFLKSTTRTFFISWPLLIFWDQNFYFVGTNLISWPRLLFRCDDFNFVGTNFILQPRLLKKNISSKCPIAATVDICYSFLVFLRILMRIFIYSDRTKLLQNGVNDRAWISVVQFWDVLFVRDGGIMQYYNGKNFKTHQLIKFTWNSILQIKWNARVIDICMGHN